MRHRRHALALVLLAAACSGSRGSSAPAPLAAPTGLTVLASSTWGLYEIAWAAPAGAFDGYEFAAAVGDGPFQVIGGDPVPSWATKAGLNATSVPETAWIRLRVRAVRGGEASEWSAAASVQQPLRDPTTIAASPTMVDGRAAAPVVVTWDCPSLVGPQVLLERAVASAAAPAWRPLATLAGCATSYADADVVDGASYLYRVTFSAGGIASRTLATPSGSPRLPILAPADVSVGLLVPADGAAPAGFRVSWTRRSAGASGVTVSRQALDETYPTDVGTVAATESVLDDLAWPQWPGARYQVRAWDWSGAEAGVSPWVAAPPFTLEGAISLASGTVTVPSADRHVRDAAGGVHGLESRGSDGIALFRPVPDGYEEHATAGNVGRLVDPGLDVDPDGHPHAVFVLARSATTDPATARHMWHDGTAWQEEDLTLDPSLDNATFAAGPSGSVHLAYTRWSANALEHVALTKEEGAWTPSVLPVPARVQRKYVLDTGPDGTTFLLVLGGAGLDGPLLLVRPPGGSWSAETVAFAGAWNGWMTVGSGGRAALFFEKRTFDLTEFWYVGRDESGAGTSELLATFSSANPAVGHVSAALAPDGSRTLCVAGLPGPDSRYHSELFVREASGGFAQLRIGPPSSTPDVSLDAAGKAAVLVRRSRAVSTAETELPTLVEPP